MIPPSRRRGSHPRGSWEDREGHSQEYNYCVSRRIQELQKICTGYNVIALYAFGSRAADMFRVLEDDSAHLELSASDLDVGVLTQLPLDLDKKVNLALELENLFHVPRLDLVVLNEADAFLAANVVRGERLYAADPERADEYELFVLSRAGDLAEWERERIAMILQGDHL